jgi:hypothetical protein
MRAASTSRSERHIIRLKIVPEVEHGSRTGEQEMDNQVFDEGHAVGLDLDEVQSSAGRQFLASLVVGVVIIAVAGLVSLRPVHHDSAGLALNGVASVQEPTFVTQHVAGRVRHEIELP